MFHCGYEKVVIMSVVTVYNTTKKSAMAECDKWKGMHCTSNIVEKK